MVELEKAKSNDLSGKAVLRASPFITAKPVGAGCPSILNRTTLRRPTLNHISSVPPKSTMLSVPERNRSKRLNLRRRKYRDNLQTKRSAQVSVLAGAPFSRNGTLPCDIVIRP